MKDLLTNFHSLHFSKELPADKITGNETRQVEDACFSFVNTKRPRNPKLVHKSSKFLVELDSSIEDEKNFVNIMSGETPFKDFKSYSMCLSLIHI